MEKIQAELKFKIGTIVALHSHFYDCPNESKTVIIVGDPKLISPLMVIKEIVLDKQPIYEETTGMQKADKNSCQCLCTYFSHKSYVFEEVWISSKLLKIIDDASKIIKKEDTKIPPYGEFVELKTSIIELGKNKSSIKQTDDKKSSTLTSELNFVCPVMQVIGTAKSDSKEPLFDSKTFTRKRIISELLVKCKYYNNLSDKFTEVLLPIETLSVIKKVLENNLNICKDAIRLNKYLKSTFVLPFDDEVMSGILKPKRINFVNGRFYLNAYDYHTTKDIDIDINELIEPKLEDNYYSDELPLFEVKRKRLNKKIINKSNLEQLIKQNGYDKKINITYENMYEVVTNRSISDYVLFESLEKIIVQGEKINAVYLKAFCHLRNAERYFRIDRIRYLKVLI